MRFFSRARVAPNRYKMTCLGHETAVLCPFLMIIWPFGARVALLHNKFEANLKGTPSNLASNIRFLFNFAGGFKGIPANLPLNLRCSLCLSRRTPGLDYPDQDIDREDEAYKRV